MVCAVLLCCPSQYAKEEGRKIERRREIRISKSKRDFNFLRVPSSK